MRIRTLLAATAVLAATASLTACAQQDDVNEANTPALAGTPTYSGEASPADGAAATPSGPSATASPAGHLDRAGLIRAITVNPRKAGSAHMTMTMGGATSIDAQGDVTYTRDGSEMQMTMTMPQAGAGTMDMRVVRGILYLTIPQVTPPGKFVKIDPSDPSNPLSKNFGHLSEQLDPLYSIHAMQAGVRKVRYVGPESVDGKDADHYVVTVDSAAMLRATHTPTVPGMPRTLTYDMWLDDHDLLSRMQFSLGTVHLDMSMSRWGEPVHVVAPPAGKVVDVSRLMSRTS